MDLLLKYSLEAERIMVPEFFESDMGEVVLRSKFEMERDAFCAVDYDALWKQNGWLDFFQTLKGGNTGTNKETKEKDIANLKEEVWEEIDDDMEDAQRHRHFIRH